MIEGLAVPRAGDLILFRILHFKIAKKILPTSAWPKLFNEFFVVKDCGNGGREIRFLAM